MKEKILAKALEKLILLGKIKTKDEFVRVKTKIAKMIKIKRLPKDADLLPFVSSEKAKPFFVKKPSKSASGIVAMGVMTKPFPCPHGKCLYCPGGVENNTPQSYVGLEPAARRAFLCDYDPKCQIRVRLKQLEKIGHPVDKLELIIMGGTFLAMPKSYKEFFVRKMFEEVTKKEGTFEELKKFAERSKIRIVGLTIETRPDYAKKEHIFEMLNYTTTRVEVGVQSIYRKVLDLNRRGHSLGDVVEATKLLKQAGFKIVYHIMPGMYGSSKRKDVRVFKILFRDERFMPDMLKIYPTLVIEKTELFDLWKKGVYKEMNDEEATEVISEGMKYIPYFVRIMRMQRDIPSNVISAGVKKSNLRELVYKRCREKNIEIKEIRYREAGLKKIKGLLKEEKPKLFIEKYKASGGKEFFISYESEDRKTIFGFLRLRLQKRTFVEELEGKAIVRELHVYGPLLPLHKRGESFQHKGFGRRLLEVGERVAKQEGFDEISIISGIGVREYYYKLGYKLGKYYVHKKL